MSFPAVAAEPEPEARPQVTIVVRGGKAPSPEQLKATSVPVDLRLVEVPNTGFAPPTPDSAAQEQIAAARKAYINADFGKCLEHVADDAAMTRALADADRTTAARVLLWRVACNVGAGKAEPAKRAAQQLAVFGLAVPPEVGSISPEVEAVIAKAYQEAAGAQALPLAISSSETGAEVHLDGRTTGCTTPCTLDVLEGSHVIRLTADGFNPTHRLVRAEKPKAQAAFELTAASPTLAAQQWTQRYAQSSEVEGSRSVKLLSTALRATRLVLLNVEDGPAPRTKALLALGGLVAARSERDGSLDKELDALMNDLLTRGNVVEPSPPLYKRPLFWIAVVVAAGLAAGGTALALTRDPVTRVEL